MQEFQSVGGKDFQPRAELEEEAADDQSTLIQRKPQQTSSRMPGIKRYFLLALLLGIPVIIASQWRRVALITPALPEGEHDQDIPPGGGGPEPGPPPPEPPQPPPAPPQPEPEPQPVPELEPAMPLPEPQPAPVPLPEPQPVPAPEPAVPSLPEPQPAPEPEVEPGLLPPEQPAPVPVGEPAEPEPAPSPPPLPPPVPEAPPPPVPEAPPVIPAAPPLPELEPTPPAPPAPVEGEEEVVAPPLPEALPPAMPAFQAVPIPRRLEDLSPEDNAKQWEADIKHGKYIASTDMVMTIPHMDELSLNEAELLTQTSLGILVTQQAAACKARCARQNTELLDLAKGLLKGLEGNSDKTVVATGLRFPGSEDIFKPKAEFEVNNIIHAGPYGVMIEVEPKDSDVRQRLKARKLAMKIYMQKVEDGMTEEDEVYAQLELRDFGDREAEFVASLEVDRTKPEKTMGRFGVLMPLCEGKLVDREEPVQQIGNVMFNTTASFLLFPETSFLNLLAQQQEQNKEVAREVKLLVLRQFVTQLALAHGRRRLHNDLKLDDLFLTREGKPYLGNFHSSGEVGDLRPTWSPANLAPEQFRELIEEGKVTSTEKAEAWAMGISCYMALTGGLPFTKSPTESYLNFLIKEDQQILKPDFDITQYPSAYISLRVSGVPEKWAAAITAMLQPDPEARPTVRQVIQAFPDIFTQRDE